MEQELLNAASWGYDERVVKILGENEEINVNWKDSRGLTPLQLACNYGYDKVVAVLLAHPDIDLNQKTELGASPLLFACSKGHTACIKLLLKDVRVKVNEYESTGYHPLSYVAYNGHLEVIKWWIASGKEMDLGEPGNERNDAIGVAMDRGYMEVVFLLERFRDHPNETKYEVRVELGWLQEKAAEFFAMVVFLCDGLLEIKRKGKAARFFSMTQRLPMELQMVLCHRVVGSAGENISVEQSESAFMKLAKKELNKLLS
jgi:hypothetical protein